jgi:hypothetical protein
LYVLRNTNAIQADYLISVTSTVDYRTFSEKILKKLRISTGRDDAPLRIRWVDSDGDKVVINCDESVSEMFAEVQESGSSHVDLLVT